MFETVRRIYKTGHKISPIRWRGRKARVLLPSDVISQDKKIVIEKIGCFLTSFKRQCVRGSNWHCLWMIQESNFSFSAFYFRLKFLRALQMTSKCHNWNTACLLIFQSGMRLTLVQESSITLELDASREREFRADSIF